MYVTYRYTIYMCTYMCICQALNKPLKIQRQLSRSTLSLENQVHIEIKYSRE